MNPDFRARVTAALAAYYGIPADDLDRPGTTLHPIDPDEWDGLLELVPIGARTAIAVPPGLRAEVRRVAGARPADHLLAGADFKAVWGDGVARVGGMKVYMMDWAGFRPFAPDPRYTVRALTPADRAAFEAFHARCSPDDRAESDISLDQIAPYGVFDGDRIVAGASTYLWAGLVDVGVLTDPDARGQGLGKAVVSAVCEHFRRLGDEAAIVCYRHDVINLESQGIAVSLGFAEYATFEFVYRGTA